MASASLSKMRIGAAITHLFFVCVLFSLLFHWGSFPRLDFWWSMTALNIALIVPAFLIDPSLHRRIFSDCRSFFFEKVIFGLASAAALYAVFFFGNMLAPLIIPGAADSISAIYDLKLSASFRRIVVLISLVIGPGEELLWRAYVQHNLSERFGWKAGFVLAFVLYAAVHFASGNLMLILAALVCGVFWGFLYQRRGSILLNAVSHVAWDLTIFVFLPLD